jgi:outer membrane receptor protein involved in Fe transport
MKNYQLLLGVSSLVCMSPALAEVGAAQDGPADAATDAKLPAKKAEQKEVFSTGVARGRDILDAAISTSSIKESQIVKLSARGLGEIFHNIPGVRSELTSGETSANVTVRGLPLATSGAKFLQIQEDGLPVVEFGDMITGGADQFLRADLNLSQIEAIRGGSASTFASNSPGGVINLISKTGDVEGGSVMASAGVNYDEYRTDFDYGAKISDTLRFHVGGFYRQGEGPRKVGFDGDKGGQLKLNITKTFTGGYIRFNAKYLDDRTPVYLPAPALVTGTNDDPKFTHVANFNVNKDTLLSRYHLDNLLTDVNNNPAVRDVREGQHSLVKSFGVETQFELAGWTVTEKFRYSDISGTYGGIYPAVVGPAAALATTFGGPGATLSYATGPNAGQRITSPSTLNGNGLIAAIITSDNDLRSFDNVTNDIRASHVWEIGGGDLTTTGGFYKSNQTIDTVSTNTSQLSDVVGDGKAALINVTTANGIALSERGAYTYDATFFGGIPKKRLNVEYDTNAAFGSLNYHVGKLSIGGSLRYDFGSAKGTIYSSQVNGAAGSVARDLNGDGVISAPERKVAITPLTSSAPVDYDYHYLSYSAGVNYRVAEELAVFGRYSRGARTNADRLLFSPAISTVDGHLADKKALIDYVTQAEAGVKFRQDGLSLNLTGFFAKTLEHQVYFGPIINRRYRTYGLEFEGGYRTGIFSINAGATYTKGEIVKDFINPAVNGNVPGGQPKVFGFVTPSIETEHFSAGVNVYGLTERFAQDANQLKLPGYMTVNPFIQYRPIDRLTVSLNVNNAFDIKGISAASVPAIPASGIIMVQGITGRTISTSVRFDF